MQKIIGDITWGKEGVGYWKLVFLEQPSMFHEFGAYLVGFPDLQGLAQEVENFDRTYFVTYVITHDLSGFLEFNKALLESILSENMFEVLYLGRCHPEQTEQSMAVDPEHPINKLLAALGVTVVQTS